MYTPEISETAGHFSCYVVMEGFIKERRMSRALKAELYFCAEEVDGEACRVRKTREPETEWDGRSQGHRVSLSDCT